MDEPVNQRFKGTGWTFPPTFTRHPSALRMSSGDDNIRQCLWVLLSTAVGERIMLASYGSDLGLRVFDSLTTTVLNDIRTSILKAILNWEPRIEVLGIDIAEQAPLDGRLAINIDFRVRQTNSRSNLVYPFYLHEATLPPPTP